MATFTLNEVAEYSDLTPWEDVEIIGVQNEADLYIVRFLEDNSVLATYSNFLRKKETANA